jgi:hypothetical protein
MNDILIIISSFISPIDFLDNTVNKCQKRNFQCFLTISEINLLTIHEHINKLFILINSSQISLDFKSKDRPYLYTMYIKSIP